MKISDIRLVKLRAVREVGSREPAWDPGGQMAFGMGASAGDYDNDGDLDLFISNMYSKAGNRIIAKAILEARRR